MNKDDTSQERLDEIAFRPSGNTAKPATPKAPTTPNTPRLTPRSRGQIILEIFRRILDAGATAPPWQDEINPRTRKPYVSKKEYDAWRSLNREQAESLRDNYPQEQLQEATNPERNSRGCFLFNTPRYDTTSAQQMAIEAISGKTTSQVVVDPNGYIAKFNVRVSPRVVGEVDTSLPETRYSDLAVPETLRRRAEIASRCGLTMNIYSTNQSEVDKAIRRGFAAKKLNMGGSYGRVRGDLKGGEVHHTPAKSVSPLSRDYGFENRFDDPGPAIWMRTEDHKKTASHSKQGNSAINYRDRQDRLIRAGRFREAFQMDVDNIRALFPDGRYEPGIRQALEQVNILERSGRLSANNSRLSIQEVADTSVGSTNTFQDNTLRAGNRYRKAEASNEERSRNVGSAESIPKPSDSANQGEDQQQAQAVELPSSADWARFTAAARTLTERLNTYGLSSDPGSILEKQLTNPQDYAQMLVLSVGANTDNDKYADRASPFTAQREDSMINIFSNSSRIATINLNTNTISIVRSMTAAEKESLEKHQLDIQSAIEAQFQNSPQPQNPTNQAQLER